MTTPQEVREGVLSLMSEKGREVIKNMLAFDDFKCPCCGEWVRAGYEIGWIDGVKVCKKCKDSNKEES